MTQVIKLLKILQVAGAKALISTLALELSPGANDEYNICLKLVVLVSNTRLLAA